MRYYGLTDVQMEVMASEAVDDAVSKVVILPVFDSVVVSNVEIRPTALVTSDVHALLSTLLLRSVIWPACTAVPRAPAAPSPRPNKD